MARAWIVLALALASCSLDRSFAASIDGDDAGRADGGGGALDAGRDGGDRDGGPRDAGSDAPPCPPAGCGCTPDDPPTELCDGRDNDCDPATADGAGEPRLGMACDGGDADRCATGQLVCSFMRLVCDDDPESTPEVCGNMVDDDCNGAIDESSAIDALVLYYDGDGDGRGDASRSGRACVNPGGWSLDASDCDDTDASVHPGAMERCNGADETCDGVIDEGGCPGCTTAWRAGRTYLFCTTAVGWSTARTACESIPGYHLVRIDDSGENDWVSATARSVAGGAFWIGLRQSGSSWTWWNGGASYTAWGSDQPDNGGFGGSAEDCAEINYRSNATWNDAVCDNGRGYVCELGP